MVQSIELIVLFSTAFLGSVGHCVGMCGGIVVAYTSGKIESKATTTRQTLSHLLYNLGRVVTYIMIGALFGGIGKALAFSPFAKGVLFVLTGILMLLAALSLVGKLKFLNTAEYGVTKHQWYQKSFRYLMNSPRYGSFFLLGILNGLIPCGLVYSFAIFAASTADPLSGAGVMAIFGLATIPALFLLGFMTKFLQQGSRREIMLRISALLIVLYGIFTLYKGTQFILYPQKMQQMLQEMQTGSIEEKLQGKCGGMKCAPGKCG